MWVCVLYLFTRTNDAFRRRGLDAASDRLAEVSERLVPEILKYQAGAFLAAAPDDSTDKLSFSLESIRKSLRDYFEAKVGMDVS